MLLWILAVNTFISHYVYVNVKYKLFFSGWHLQQLLRFAQMIVNFCQIGLQICQL